MPVATVGTVDTVAKTTNFYQITNDSNGTNGINDVFYPLKNGSNSVCSSSSNCAPINECFPPPLPLLLRS